MRHIFYKVIKFNNKIRFSLLDLQSEELQFLNTLFKK